MTSSSTNAEATRETGERLPPFSQADGRSIWWRWTAPATGMFEINTLGSELIDTALAVYTGTQVNDLDTEVTNNDIGGGEYRSRVFLEATTGVTYSIQVMGLGLSGRGIVLGRTPHQWQAWPFTTEIVTRGASRYLAIHFTLPAGYTTLVNALLKVEESTDLGTWTTADNRIYNGNWGTNTERWTEGGVTHIRVHTSVPIHASQPKAWLRLAARVTS